MNLLRSQFNSFFSQSSVRRQCNQRFVHRLFVSKSAINQNASINKNSKNSNSKSLKQHTLAKSISFCCFCFCFAQEIDRFIILICRYFRDQNSQQDFHFDCFDIYFVLVLLFLFRIYFFTFIAFALTFSTSIMIRQIFESQSMNFFAMSIDRKNEYSFRNEI